MTKKIYSLKDEKAEAFSQPFFMDTDGQALRALDGIVNNPETQVNRYPQDFTLYRLGTYDEKTGRLESRETPKLLASATDFVKHEAETEKG